MKLFKGKTFINPLSNEDAGVVGNKFEEEFSALLSKYHVSCGVAVYQIDILTEGGIKTFQFRSCGRGHSLHVVQLVAWYFGNVRQEISKYIDDAKALGTK